MYITKTNYILTAQNCKIPWGFLIWCPTKRFSKLIKDIQTWQNSVQNSTITIKKALSEMDKKKNHARGYLSFR